MSNNKEEEDNTDLLKQMAITEDLYHTLQESSLGQLPIEVTTWWNPLLNEQTTK